MKTPTPKNTNKNKVTLAYSYRRYSSKNQTQGTSLERQLQDAVTVCNRQGWKLIDLPPDKGVSAYKVTDDDGLTAANMHKGNLGAFLKRVEDGDLSKGSVLIVERLDRFSRNYFDIVFPVWLSILQSGIGIYSCATGVHYTLESIRSNPMLASMALMELANANKYSSDMGDRIGRATAIRLAECIKGKKMNLGCWQPRWIDFIGEKGKEGIFKFNKHAETIRRIVKEYIDGQSMYQIATGLIKDKTPTLQGGKWNQGTISNILIHESLIGDKTIKTIKLKRYYPPLIDGDTWQALRARRAENKERKGGGGASQSEYVGNLFRNRCKCFNCGGPMVVSHGYYTCRNRLTDECKSQFTIKSVLIEMSFFADVLQKQPEMLLSKQNGKHNKEVAEIKTRLADVDNQIKDATKLLGRVKVEVLETRLIELTKTKDALLQDLERLNIQMLSTANALTNIVDLQALFNEVVIGESDGVNVKLDETGLGVIRDAFDRLKESLKDNDTRKRLLLMLPTIVKGLEMNTNKQEYRIINLAGEKGSWICVGD